jgi:hypothetical protein
MAESDLYVQCIIPEIAVLMAESDLDCTMYSIIPGMAVILAESDLYSV